MKKLRVWGTVGLLTMALPDPLPSPILDKPIQWLRDILMAAGGFDLFLPVNMNSAMRLTEKMVTGRKRLVTTSANCNNDVLQVPKKELFLKEGTAIHIFAVQQDVN